MALPKEPRQLMINLMYLVLTAMLALNITREVLEAFRTINNSIEQSNSSIDSKNESIYKAFEVAAQKESSKDRVKPYADKALEIKAESDKFFSYLGTWKDSVIDRSGGYVDNNGVKELKSMEDIDAATRLFVEEKKGDIIKSKLQEYVDFLLARIDDPAERESLKKQLPIQIKDPPKSEDNPSGSWTYGTFHNIPVVATITMFSKFQNDVRNSESIVLENLYKHIDDNTVVFDALEAIAVPKTSYALEGQEMEAKVMLVAYNKSYNPNMGPNVKVENGIGTMKFKASGAGLKTVNGQITREVNGEQKSYPYNFQYMVGSAGASLQLDKMNVMYIGVPNPITLSASGYNIEDVKLSMPGADLQADGKGKYIVNVSKAGTLDWSITGVRGTSSSSIAAGKIRVKNIPPPTAKIAGKFQGMIPTSTAKAQQGVFAELENFDFDTKFTVTKFRFVWIRKIGDAVPIEVVGNRFNGDCQRAIDQSRPGDKWLIENVFAVGPDKVVRPINSVSLTLN